MTAAMKQRYSVRKQSLHLRKVTSQPEIFMVNLLQPPLVRSVWKGREVCGDLGRSLRIFACDFISFMHRMRKNRAERDELGWLKMYSRVDDVIQPTTPT